MAKATLRVAFYRPGTEDQGEMIFVGDAEFIAKCAAPVSYVISWLNATYGADRDNWIKAGNELSAAWEAVKEGKTFKGDIVSVSLEK